MKRQRMVSVLAAAFLAIGCRAEPTAVSDAALTVARGATAFRLQNASAVPINYFIVERDLAARLDWAACVGPTCPAVPPSGSIAVTYAQVAGYAAGAREAIVYWWHSIPASGGGYLADSIRAVDTPF